MRQFANMQCIALLLIVLTSIIEGVPKVCPKILDKKEWGGRKGFQVEYSLIPTEYVVIHHTVTPACRSVKDCERLIQGIQNFHMNDLEFHDIGYNFLIGGDGNVYEGVGWHKVGAHTRSFNTRSLGVAFVGNFSDTMPNSLQLGAAKALLKCGVELGELSESYKLIGARQVSSTQSPGARLFREIRTWPHFERNP